MYDKRPFRGTPRSAPTRVIFSSTRRVDGMGTTKVFMVRFGAQRVLPKVDLRGGDGVVAEHGADVLDRRVTGVEDAGEGAAQVVRSEVGEADLFAAAVHDAADAFDGQRAHRIAQDVLGAPGWTRDLPAAPASRRPRRLAMERGAPEIEV